MVRQLSLKKTAAPKPLVNKHGIKYQINVKLNLKKIRRMLGHDTLTLRCLNIYFPKEKGFKLL